MANPSNQLPMEGSAVAPQHVHPDALPESRCDKSQTCLSLSVRISNIGFCKACSHLVTMKNIVCVISDT